MGDIPRAGAIRGTTMNWAWTDGPTKGKVYEHIFHEDGTVEWHDAGLSGDNYNADVRPLVVHRRR